jgi:maltose O-acetyltransferase
MKSRNGSVVATKTAEAESALSLDETAAVDPGGHPSPHAATIGRGPAGVAPPVEPDGRRSPFASLLISLRQDVLGGFRWLFVNWFAGSRLVPRVVRFALLRVAGVRLESPNLVSGYLIETRSLRIGRGTFVNWGCTFEGSGSITLGEGCHIGPEVMFVTSTHPWNENGHVERRADYLPVRIGDRCWLGARSMVLPGVAVEDDVVVAAGAVVTRDCEAGGLYAGVPAHRIR